MSDQQLATEGVSSTWEMRDRPGAARAPGFRLGALLGRRYRIDRLLGAGGMGAVLLAFDEVLGKEVALKFLDERLPNEVLLAHEVSHKNVCRTYDLEEVEDRWVIKMEYVDGETVGARVAHRGPLPLDEVLDIARQI